MKIRLELKLADMWVGVFWRKTPTGNKRTHCEYTFGVGFWEEELIIVDVWICLLPCLPIHLTWTMWRNR